MKKNFLFIALLLFLNNAFSQPDSIKTSLELNLMGRWQTGNLNQLVVSPSVNWLMKSESFSSDFNANYQYLVVNGFNVINDFWTRERLKLRPNKRISPFLMVYYGFAKSYKIDHSLFAAGGLGINIYRKSPLSFLQFHVFGGYLNLQFEGELPHAVLAFGSLTKAAFPLGKQVNMSWELDTYHSASNLSFWGANNIIMFHFMISKHLSLNMSHNIIFNNKTAESIEKVNTLMLFGIRFKTVSSKNNTNIKNHAK